MELGHSSRTMYVADISLMSEPSCRRRQVGPNGSSVHDVNVRSVVSRTLLLLLTKLRVSVGGSPRRDEWWGSSTVVP